eukprot:TRINITY_DN77015_c0_g1_i1.p1 TRINITY_DN77015_c0_g1~~TRINITY_DN77015_c0_g1_i1.p1  ORF type:complete len:773 (+),score=104.80 TRINITY_DN77015_c0_g1_i1:34-2352(+)
MVSLILLLASLCTVPSAGSASQCEGRRAFKVNGTHELLNQPAYFRKSTTYQLAGRSLYLSSTLASVNATEKVVPGGLFLYFCEKDRRWMLARAGCHEGKNNNKICYTTILAALLRAEAANGQAGWCPGVLRSSNTSLNLSVDDARLSWEALEVSTVISDGSIRTWLSWIPGLGVSTAWESVDVVMSTVHPCFVDNRSFHPWMNAADVGSFCLGGWGESPVFSLCESGYLQHPAPLQCWDGQLNLIPVPADVLGDESRVDGWFCSRTVPLRLLLHFDELPPFYYMFAAVIIKACITLLLFGPPKTDSKTETSSFKEQAKQYLTRALQGLTFAAAITSLVSDLFQAWTVAAWAFSPEELEGLPTELPVLIASIVRSLALASLVLCTSGLNGNFAVVLALEALYRDHYIMAFAISGELAAANRAEDDPVPLETRYGLENSVARSGHSLDDWKAIMGEREGCIMKYYVKFVEATRWLYDGIIWPWVILGGLAYFWIMLPLSFLTYSVADRLAGFALMRAEQKSLPASNNLSSEYMPVAAEELDSGKMPLSDKAIYFLMLEWTSHSELVLTQDVEDVYESDSGSATVAKLQEGETEIQSFKAGSELSAVDDLKYSRICAEPSNPDKRIEISWMVGQTDAKGKQVNRLRKGFVPVEKVTSGFSSSEAQKQFAAKYHAYVLTGATHEAWTQYFEGPMGIPLFKAILGTLAVRFIVFWLAWPAVEGKLDLPNWIPSYFHAPSWAAYFQALKTFQDRTIRGYTNTLLKSALKGVDAVNMLV